MYKVCESVCVSEVVLLKEMIIKKVFMLFISQADKSFDIDMNVYQVSVNGLSCWFNSTFLQYF